MREDGLRAIHPPKFVPRTTESKHGNGLFKPIIEPNKANKT
jgi:hypothetical protein